MRVKKPYEIVRTIKKDEIPGRNPAPDFTPLLKAVATLGAEEVLEIRVKKNYQAIQIRKAIADGFKKARYDVIQLILN